MDCVLIIGFVTCLYPGGLSVFATKKGVRFNSHEEAMGIILGTACSRPLLFEEAEEVQRVAKGAIIIARLDPDPAIPNGLTFDLLPAGQGTWFHRMCLWQEPFSRRLWLVPAEGQGPSAMLSRSGAELVGYSPFCSLPQLEAGIACAAESLRLAGEVS